MAGFRLPGTCRVNEQGTLVVGGVEVTNLVQRFGTPLYVFDEAHFRSRCREYRAALARFYPQSRLLYAGKACLTTGLVRLLLQEGLGLDVVSGGELYTALKAGFPAANIVMHGNNKTPEELELALTSGVGRFVVDSFDELDLLEQMAARFNTTAEIWLRVTPGIEAHTHSHIQTGQIDSKFGFPLVNGQALAAVQRALVLPHLRLRGIHAHIGSQILETEPFRLLVGVLAEFLATVRASTGQVLSELDLGGGLGIRYTEADDPPAPSDMVQVIATALERECKERELPLPQLVLEPGRSLVGEAGLTLYTVGTRKEIPGVRTYVSVDGGMADNPRVALYQAEYTCALANRMLDEPEETVTIAGRFCESGDILIKDVRLPRARRGDILVVFSTGAYHYSMASNYNRVPRPAMVTVYEGEADLLVERETYEDLTRLDRIPARYRKWAAAEAAASGSYRNEDGLAR